MRLGIFGAGRIGTFHATLASELPEVERLEIYDVAEDRAVALATRLGGVRHPTGRAFGTGVVASPAELADSVDAAIIASPTASHTDLVHLCIDRGLPTFCEKPVALDLAALRKVCEHVDEVGALLQVGFQRRFDAGYREARRLRRDGALGRVYGFRAYSHDRTPPPPSYITTSGGVFRDLHIHDFDIARYVLEREVEEVYATGSVLAVPEYGELGDYDISALVLRMTDGTLGVLTGGRHNAAGYDVRMELLGSRDTVAVGLDDHVALRSVEPGMAPFTGRPHTDFQHRFEDAYRRELTEFVAFASRGGPNPCEAHDAYEALRIATAADRSAHERRPVRLDEVGA